MKPLDALFVLVFGLVVPAATHAQAPATSPPARPSPTPPPPAPDLVTLAGKVYHHPRVSAVEPDGVTYFHRGGVAKIPFEELPEAVRKQYHPDAKKAAASPAAREAAGQAPLAAEAREREPAAGVAAERARPSPAQGVADPDAAREKPLAQEVGTDAGVPAPTPRGSPAAAVDQLDPATPSASRVAPASPTVAPRDGAAIPPRRVWVNAYTRRDGTYVEGYWRKP